MWFCVVTVLLLVLTPVHSDVADFFRNLSMEFADAWERLKDAIKQPVRLRRLGKLGKQKITKPSHTTTRILTFTQSTESVTRTRTVRTSRTTLLPLSRRVMIPLLRGPQYESVVQWSQLQKPYISELKAHEFTLTAGKGFEFMVEKTIFPTHTTSLSTRSRVVEVPVLRLPAYRSLEQWRYLQLPRYAMNKPMGTIRKAPTRVAFTINAWNLKEVNEVTKPKRTEDGYLSKTLLTENLVKMDKDEKNLIQK